jgi:hypothetical protein
VSSLSEIVLDALDVPEQKREEKDPRELIKDDDASWGIDEIIGYAERAKGATRGDIWQTSALLVAVCEQSMMAEPEDGFLVFLFDAHDAEAGDGAALQRHRDRLGKFVDELREELYIEAREDTLWGWHGTLDFFEGVWGAEAKTALSEITGVGQRTAHKWLHGGESSNANYRRVRQATVAFYDLIHRASWSEADCRAWAQKPINKKTPLQLFGESSPYAYAPELRAEMKHLLGKRR